MQWVMGARTEKGCLKFTPFFILFANFDPVSLLYGDSCHGIPIRTPHRAELLALDLYIFPPLRPPPNHV